MDVKDIDQLGLEQGANVHPFLMHLLDSTKEKNKNSFSKYQNIFVCSKTI